MINFLHLPIDCLLSIYFFLQLHDFLTLFFADKGPKLVSGLLVVVVFRCPLLHFDIVILLAAFLPVTFGLSFVMADWLSIVSTSCPGWPADRLVHFAAGRAIKPFSTCKLWEHWTYQKRLEMPPLKHLLESEKVRILDCFHEMLMFDVARLRSGDFFFSFVPSLAGIRGFDSWH